MFKILILFRKFLKPLQSLTNVSVLSIKAKYPSIKKDTSFIYAITFAVYDATMKKSD